MVLAVWLFVSGFLPCDIRGDAVKPCDGCGRPSAIRTLSITRGRTLCDTCYNSEVIAIAEGLNEQGKTEEAKKTLLKLIPEGFKTQGRGSLWRTRESQEKGLYCVK